MLNVAFGGAIDLQIVCSSLANFATMTNSMSPTANLMVVAYRKRYVWGVLAFIRFNQVFAFKGDDEWRHNHLHDLRSWGSPSEAGQAAFAPSGFVAVLDPLAVAAGHVIW